MKLLGICLVIISVITLFLLPFNLPTNFHGQVDGISLLLWAFCKLIAITAFVCGLVLAQSK